MKTSAALCALAISLAAPAAEAQRRPKTVTVGVVLDGAAEGERILFDAMKAQLIKAAADSYAIEFPADKVLPGDFDAAKIRAALDRLLGDPRIDVIWTFGVLGSAEAASRASLARPVIAPFILDREAQKLPFKAGASGLKNLSYIEVPFSLDRDLQLFVEVAGVTRVALLASKYVIDGRPGLGPGLIAEAKQVGVDLSLIGAAGTAADILALIPAGTTGVYLGPLAQTTPEERRKLIAALIDRKIPIFGGQGEVAAREGALVARRPNSAAERIARRVALNTLRIAGGDDAGTLPVALSFPERVIINIKTARAVGVSPTWQTLTEAELINTERRDAGQTLSLASVTRGALAGNVSVRALRQVVAAGRASVRAARSNLLPQIEASTTARVIDADRADASFGSAPELLWTGDLSFTQLLWSERAWAGYTAEKHVQRSREAQLQQARWDIAAEVGIAYLNVLRTQTAERIQRNNLKLTRANLELAQTRLAAGASSRADVFRWEAQIANDRRAVIDASAQRNLSEIDLMRILHRPPEERFSTTEGDLTSSAALDPSRGLFRFINDPWTFRLFRAFMIEEALRQAPEVKQIDAAIAAQQRLLDSARRAPYSPTVGLSAGLTQNLLKAGSGDEPPMPTGADDTEWFVALSLSLPLYSGGARYAEIDRNRAEVARLQAERDNVRDQISQRAVSALHLMGASYAGIRLSREAARAARENYELVAGAYAQGAARIVELLDAQNAALTADQVAADAVFNFLIDWVNVQRATGRFELLASGREMQDLIDRAARYIDARRGEP